MRAVLGMFAGIVAGFAAMLAIATIGGLIFPSSARIDAINAEQIVAAFPTLPMGAKIAIILSWFGGALVGAALAKKIAGRGWAAWTVAGLFALYVMLTVLILPMPSWLQGVAVLAPLIGGLIANHLVADRGDAAPAAPFNS
jgi:hypothetical protein